MEHFADSIVRNMDRFFEREKEKKQKEGRTNEEKIRDFLDSHDVWTEYVATKNVIDMARATGGRVHLPCQPPDGSSGC